jgi:hypothetical protein
MYRPLPAENDVVTSLVALLRYHQRALARLGKALISQQGIEATYDFNFEAKERPSGLLQERGSRD